VVTLALSSPREQRSTSTVPFHVWVMPSGGDWMQFYRVDGGFLLRFPDLADFSLPPDGSNVVCIPVPGVSQPTLEHLYLNQVLPLVLGKHGSMVFHGSAVAMDRGAIVFLGSSGRGKSTLAAAFATQGRAFLTDDALVLDALNGRYTVQPSHASIRLWEDSRERLLDFDAALAPAVDYTSKARLLAGPGLVHCGEPRSLLTAYVLGDGSADGITFRRLSETENLLEWTKHSFLLDVEDRALVQQHFERVVALANRVSCYALDYPRRYDALDKVLAALTDHAATLDTPE
jgi:hypothetical protein